MQINHGIDIVNTLRIQSIHKKFGDKFLTRIFTEQEISNAYKNKEYNYLSLAKRFAAKEAFSKATGKGIGEIAFVDIEILNDDFGAPYINIGDKLKNYLNINKKWNNYNISLSLSDEHPFAIASVIILVC